LKKSLAEFEIYLQPSVKLKLVIVCSFLLALISCWLNRFSFGVQCVLAISVVFTFIYALRSGVFSYRNVSKIHCKTDGYWALLDRDGQSEIYKLKDTSVILGPFFFLHFESITSTINLVVVSDSMTLEEERRLRVALRIYKNQLLLPKA